ncbi:ATP-binding protein [Isosphaeraceae bacterium EP7]
MSLTTRLSVFFLAALAAVLIGFSGAIYSLGASYLTRQLDDRLEQALDTLEAAVDVETEGLEWEPEDRRLLLGLEPDVEDVRWAIQLANGRILDQSVNSFKSSFAPPDPNSSVLPPREGDATVVGTLPGWRLARRHLRLPELLKLGRGHQDDDQDDPVFSTMILTVGLSPAPAEASLRNLAMAVICVSTALWLACAVAGRRFIRRALAPLTKMAASARSMELADASHHLPTPGTGDELEDLGRAFNGLLDRVHESFDRQGRFTGDASHQLRTPIAGLLSLIEVVRRRPRPADEYEQTLDQVHREASRLRQIVESLLFLARTEAEAVHPNSEVIDLATWLPEQLRRWHDHDRGDDLRVEVSDAPARVNAHPPLFSQMVDNLVDNAFKYSETGTSVRVACWPEADATMLVVEDHGCGLSAEEAEAVFDPFYRSPRARMVGRPGVGLGLSVVRRIAAAGGGTVRVESRPDAGARFILRFPKPADVPSPPTRPKPVSQAAWADA